MEIVLIANEKGGTGKTATAICLANALTGLGYKVLAVDFDPSGSLSSGALPENPEWVLYDVFIGACPLDKAIYHTDICDILPTVKEIDVDVAPAEGFLLGTRDNKSLTRLADRLAGRAGAEQVLRSLLRTKQHHLAEKYDFIIIDSAPSDNILVTNAIVAADSILIPCEPSADSLDGIWEFMSSMIAASRNYVGAKAQVDGIVLARCSEQYACYRSSIQDIQTAADTRGLYLYRTRMRMSANIPDAMRNYRPILDYLNSSGVGAVDALNLALEFLESRGLEPKTEFPGVWKDTEGHLFYSRPKAAVQR